MGRLPASERPRSLSLGTRPFVLFGAASYRLRQCGLFLPDLSKPFKRERPPEEHLKANTVLSLLTIVASFTLSILLFAFFGFRSDTHPLIYVTAGLLLGIGAWHIQSLIRTQLLKKQWKRRAPLTEIQAALTENPVRIRIRLYRKVVRSGRLCGHAPSECD